MEFGTKVIHAGIEPDPATGAIMTPVYQTSTFLQAAPGRHKGYEYSRTQNPTRKALENNLAILENGRHGITFASGMAAIDAVVRLLKPGEEVIASSDLYGGTYRIFTRIYQEYGIRFHFIDMHNEADISRYLTDDTKLIWIETPTNPMLNIIDIHAVCDLVKDMGILVGVDNTFATPCLQQPLDLGADIVVHSLTKYLGGHSDLVMGAIVVKDDDLTERLNFIKNACGAVAGPQDAFLVLRGIKTLEVRMERHCTNAKKIATFLNEHPAVDKVYWPGLSAHKKHTIAVRQMKDFGGMISFTLKDINPEGTHKVLSSFRIFSLAESLGGVESLCGHPASMSHASVPKREREKLGISDSLIRLSVGIEDVRDLIADLDQALDHVSPGS